MLTLITLTIGVNEIRQMIQNLLDHCYTFHYREPVRSRWTQPVQLARRKDFSLWLLSL
jgi:hypothetical protein